MQTQEPQQPAGEHERIARTQQVDEVFFHLAEQRADAPLADEAHLDQGRLDDGADVHAVLACDALAAHMHAALAVTEQLAPAFVGGKRIAAVLDEAQHGVEILARQIGVGRGTAHLGVHVVGFERRRTRQPQQMLRQHVQPARPRQVAVEFARRDAEHGGLAFQHLEPVGRHQDRARGLIHPVVGAADALQQSGNALRRADLDHLIHSAPVDAEIERRGRHHGTQLAAGHRRLDATALLHLQRAVMQRDRQRRFVQPPQRLEQQFRLCARVDEDDRHAGRADLRHHPRRCLQAHVAGPRQLAFRQHN